jgi:hypothetical protein
VLLCFTLLPIRSPAIMSARPITSPRPTKVCTRRRFRSRLASRFDMTRFRLDAETTASLKRKFHQRIALFAQRLRYRKASWCRLADTGTIDMRPLLVGNNHRRPV